MHGLRSQDQIISSWIGAYDKPTLSVCCITYNHEKYIKQAIDGFLIQETDFPIEILIHDDASTDSTADIIRSYQLQYPLIVKPTFQTVNQFSKGLNVGIDCSLKVAKGEFIALCEGDDYWTDKNKLKTQVDFLKQNSDYSMSSHDVLFEFDGVLEKQKGYTSQPIIDASLEQLLHAGFFIALNSMVFRKSLLEFPPWIYKLQGIHKAMIYMLTSRGLNHHFPIIMGVKRRHQGGITVVDKFNREKSYYARNIFLLENLKDYCNHSKDKVINRKIRKLLVRKAWGELKKLHFHSTIASLFKVLKFF